MNWIAVKYFSLDQDLQELSDYLRARGLQHRITEEQGQQCLWVLDERVVPALQEFLAQYSQGGIRLDSAPVAETAPYSAPSVIQQVMYVPVVVSLIALSILGYFLQQGVFGFTAVNTVTFAPLGVSYSKGELWRILTPVFLHFSVLHIVFNCMCVGFGAAVGALSWFVSFYDIFCCNFDSCKSGAICLEWLCELRWNFRLYLCHVWLYRSASFF